MESMRSVVFLMLLKTCFGIEEEPLCPSSFDFSHKLLMKVVNLEFEQAQLLERLDLQDNLVKTLQQQLTNTETELKIRVDVAMEFLQRVERVVSLDGPGTTYVRWGRTTCPENGTELVYQGYAGGSHYTYTGAAASYMCLPTDPAWGSYDDSEQGGGGAVFGAEYEFDKRNIPDYFGDPGLRDKDVPCAVCRTKRTSVLMIPGRNICYDGWTTEYAGYLTGGDYGHASASEYVCMDLRPESLVGGVNSDNGKLFYFVEARCGSLRCPPYVHGRELTCVVCSK